MKKGLLTLLAASLVFVGCQNYDDQFDDLNAQISALKSQVDGLSSLSGQVSSLSGTISGLQSGIAAAQAAASSAASAAAAAGTEAAAATAAGNAAAAAATAAGDAATAAATAAGTEAAAATAAANAATAAANAATAAVDAIAPTDLSALSASLAELAADVAAVQAAIATAATAEAVTALQAEIDAIEADLDDLLVSNNVYSTAVTITDAASMAAALALGNKVQLMNATVTITDASTVADADIQTFVNRIKTMNGTFVYNSGSATGFVPTFDEMVSAKAITLTPAGDISFKKLTTATTIRINDDYETKITSVDFGALTSLTTFNDDGSTANKINLTAATNVDLASLTRHTSSSSLPFTIITKKGATVDITALDDVGTTGLQEDLYLELNGAASFSKTNIADGDIGLTNVATASISNFFGTLDVNAGVVTLTVVDGVNLDLSGSSDLTTATLDFAYDYDPDLSTAAAAIAAAGYSDTYTQDLDDGDIDFSDLESLTVTGKLLDLYVDGTQLTSLSIDATMHDLEINTATDLTSLTVSSDSKIGNVTLTGLTNLAVADFNHTTNLTDTDATAQKSVNVSVTSNSGLTKLHFSGDDVDNLTITGNAALAELDFTGLTDDGAETSALAGGVTIWGNDLTAVAANNTKDADTATATTGADGGTADAGNFDDGTSGMDTLKTYLTHIAATTGSTAFVTFDTVQTETDTETTGTTTTQLNITDAGDGSTTNEATVLKMTAAVANTADPEKGAIAARLGFFGAASAVVQFSINGASIPTTAYALTGNEAVDAAAIDTAANRDLFSAVGITLDAYAKGFSYSTVSLIDHPQTASVATGERYSTNALLSAASTTATGSSDGVPVWSTSLSDTFTLAVGGNTVTVSLGGVYGGSQSATALSNIEAAIKNAWGVTYGNATTSTASASAIATLTGADDGLIEITMLQTDSGGWGKGVSFSANDAGTSNDSRTNANIDHVIGLTRSTSDNSTIATDAAGGLIITLTSNDAGTALNKVSSSSSSIIDVSTGASLGIFQTDYTTNTDYVTTTAAHTTVERTDVRSAEDLVAAGTSTYEAPTLFNRVTWLS